MPKVIILQGIPCSGKSTWITKHCPIDYQGYRYTVLSCDDIRNQMFGKKYKHNNADEIAVWEIFYSFIENSVTAQESFIIDNTNLKQKYINQIMCRLTDNYEIEIRRFHVPLWKAHLRNIIRRVKTGKWIPIKIMNNFHKRYKQLKQNG